MATGDTIFILDPLGYSPPATLYATPDVITDASTPAAEIPVLDFDPTTAEWAYWFLTVPSHYGGGGFTISWKGGTDTANAGTLQLDVRMVKIADATTLTGDLGLDSATGVAQISDTPAATANQLNYSGTDTLTHSEAGSLSAGDRVGISVTRNVATDTNTGDLQLAEILIKET